MLQQIVNVPPDPLLGTEMAFYPLGEILSGGSNIHVIAFFKSVSAQFADRDRPRFPELDIEQIG